MPALVEGMFRAVEQAGHRRRQVEEAQGGFQFPHVVGGVAAVHEGDAVEVVVVDEGHEPVRALAVLALVVQLLGQLAETLAVHEHVLDVLAQGKKSAELNE